MRTGTEFNEIADALFERIVGVIDRADVAEDVELNEGVLEICCVDGTKIILNRHAPTQEIWLAAKSGGYHFKWVNGLWLDTRTGEPLTDALCRVLLEQTGIRVLFD